MSDKDGLIRSIDPHSAVLESWPVPEEDILQGNPAPSGKVLWQSDNQCLLNGVWSCTRGSFQFEFTWDETIYFIDGQVEISDQSGHSQIYNGGDYIHISKGTKTVWKVKQKILKVFYIRSDDPVVF